MLLNFLFLCLGRNAVTSKGAAKIHYLNFKVNHFSRLLVSFFDTALFIYRLEFPPGSPHLILI